MALSLSASIKVGESPWRLSVEGGFTDTVVLVDDTKFGETSKGNRKGRKGVPACKCVNLIN